MKPRRRKTIHWLTFPAYMIVTALSEALLLLGVGGIARQMMDFWRRTFEGIQFPAATCLAPSLAYIALMAPIFLVGLAIIQLRRRRTFPRLNVHALTGSMVATSVVSLWILISTILPFMCITWEMAE